MSTLSIKSLVKFINYYNEMLSLIIIKDNVIQTRLIIQNQHICLFLVTKKESDLQEYRVLSLVWNPLFRYCSVKEKKKTVSAGILFSKIERRLTMKMIC